MQENPKIEIEVKLMSNDSQVVRLVEPEELAAIEGVEDVSEGAAKAGGVISVRIYLEVEGFGSFRAGPFNTAAGHSSGWVKPGAMLSLRASAAPGWKFSHWTLNGLFAGTNPSSQASARAGLKIKAYFTQSE